MPTVLTDSPYALEIELELGGVDKGVHRYWRAVRKTTERGDGAALKPAERLLLGWFGYLRKAIRRTQRAVLAGEPGKGRGVYGPAINVVTADKLAVITLHEALGACLVAPSGVNLPNLARQIGRAVNAEWNVPRLRADAEAWYALVHTDRERLRPAAIQRVARRTLPDGDWGRVVHAHLGAALLSLLMDVAYIEDRPAFRTKIVQHGTRRRERLVLLSDAARRAIDDGHAARQYLRPVLGLMVVPPIPWTALDRGGYLQVKTPLVKKADAEARRRLAEADLTDVYEAVNVLGAAAWRIQPAICDVVETLWDSGGAYGHIPAHWPEPYPPRPADWETNLAAKNQWKREAARLYRRNALTLPDRLNFAYKLQAAREARSYPAVYEPHSLDFRGRAYPLPVRLNHAQDDVSRGLLEFAEAKPLTDRGNYWLGVHLANCCGVDHVPFDQRYAWTEANAEAICGWAENPLDNTGWLTVGKGKKPFQALAASMAFVEANETGTCRTPVQMDGSCNALQHWAALGRDAEAAAAVNLLPGDEPADVYCRIVERVALTVQRGATLGSKLARMLDGHIDRDVVKQTAMTTTYSVTPIGARRQIAGQLAGIEFDEALFQAVQASLPSGTDPLYEASKYLAKLTMNAMEQVCPGPMALMAWVRTCADIIAKSGQAVAWTAPSGLPVVQPYRHYGYSNVHTVLQTIRLGDFNLPGKVKRRRQVQGAAPNFVHSVDAAHMMLTARRCAAEGITFAGVHDSYWCHPSDMDRLHEILRETFVEIHREPILENLLAEWRTNYPGCQFPEIPPFGTLDITQVLQSPYFFS